MLIRDVESSIFKYKMAVKAAYLTWRSWFLSHLLVEPFATFHSSAFPRLLQDLSRTRYLLDTLMMSFNY